jgi:hypothetical protein
MILHCCLCKQLALCEPDGAHGGEDETRVPLSDLLEGRERGCDGCRLLCEVMPLLGGYYRSEVDAHNIRFGRGSALLDENGIGQWTLVVEDENNNWIGEFELQRRDSKWHVTLSIFSALS